MDFKIQALRSKYDWSVGKTIIEHSIFEGYYKNHELAFGDKQDISEPFSSNISLEGGYKI